MRKSALITGICGQDGYYLARLLQEKGYQVFGNDVPAAVEKCDLSGDFDGVEFLNCNLTSSQETKELVGKYQFREIYNLAGISFVPASWERPEENLQVNTHIPINLLEAIHQRSPESRIYQAGSSELFGNAPETPQKETTPFHPRSPYSINKIHAFNMMELYRSHYGIFAVNGIMYNHESPRRPENFVSRKITRAAAAIKLGLRNELELGSLDAKRDWSFAGDIVRAMHLTLQHDEPESYVIGSGKIHTVGDLCAQAFGFFDLDYSNYVKTNPAFVRKETSIPQADTSKLRKLTGWTPEVSFEELIQRMVENDLRELQETQEA